MLRTSNSLNKGLPTKSFHGVQNSYTCMKEQIIVSLGVNQVSKFSTAVLSLHI